MDKQRQESTNLRISELSASFRVKFYVPSSTEKAVITLARFIIKYIHNNKVINHLSECVIVERQALIRSYLPCIRSQSNIRPSFELNRFPALVADEQLGARGI